MSNKIDDLRFMRWMLILQAALFMAVTVFAFQAHVEAEHRAEAMLHDMALELDLEKCRADRAEGVAWWTLHELRPPIRIDVEYTTAQEGIPEK
jgi:hypothetical protein